MNLTLRQLRVFATIAEVGSFRGAAARLNLTPGAVSIIVRELEEEVGFPLFDRTTRRVSLSRSGREFMPAAQRVLRSAQAAALTAEDVRLRASGVLQIAAPIVLSVSVLPPLIAAYRSHHPDVVVRPLDCATRELPMMIADDRADLALGPGRAQVDGVTCSHLHKCTWAAWHTPAFLASFSGVAPWSALAGERIIVAGAEYQTMLDEAYRNRPSAKPEPSYAVENMTTALGIASAGLGIALAPTYVNRLAGWMGLQRTSLRSPTLTRYLSVYVSETRTPTPALRTFLEFAKSRLARSNWFEEPDRSRKATGNRFPAD